MQPTRRPHRLALPTALLALATALTLHACAPGGGGGEGEDPQAAPAGPPATNQELGITLSRVPAGFEVVRNEGSDLVLARTDPEDPARLEILVGPVQSAGINLKEQVWEEKARIESLPEGDYKGQNELGGAAIGTVYTSRGRFVNDAGQTVEEYRALAVHPVQSPDEHRLLILDYEYPPTEKTGERLTQLMQVLETIEAARAAGAGGAAAN